MEEDQQQKRPDQKEMAGKRKCKYMVDPVRTGRRLGFLMNYFGYSVKEVSQFLGMENPQGVYHWLHGRNCPSLDNLYALGALFHVPLDQMVCGNREDLKITENRVITYNDLLAWKSREEEGAGRTQRTTRVGN